MDPGSVSDAAAGRRLCFEALVPTLWSDLEALFGSRGGCGGCWCMWWRSSGSQFERHKGAANHDAFRRRVVEGPPPGILAYAGQEPVGWCAVAPRSEYPRLASSRVLAAADQQAVWSVSCLFVARPHRGQGVSLALLRAAIRHVRQAGGEVLEGYPVDAGNRRRPDAFVWTGLAGTFRKAGFEEVLRRSPTRPIMRHFLGRSSIARR